MPFQPVNFLKGPIIGSPLRNVVTGAGQGFAMVQEAQRRQLENALRKIQNQYAPEEEQAKLDLLRAQAGHAARAGQPDPSMVALQQFLSGGEQPAQPMPQDGSQSYIPSMNQQPRLPPPVSTGLTGQTFSPEQAQMLAQAFRGQAPTQGRGVLGEQPMPSGVQSPSPEKAQMSLAGAPQEQQPSIDHQMPLGSDEKVIQQGDPRLKRLDEAATHPEFAAALKKMGRERTQKVTVNPSTGQVMLSTTMPSGEIRVKAVDVGQRPQDIERAKEFAKSDVKAFDDLNKSYRSGLQQGSTLNELSGILTNPTFQDMTKGGAFPATRLSILKYTGTPEQKRLIGNFFTTTNQLIKDNARDFAGQFRTGEQALLNKMKVNDSDSLQVAQGKAQALMTMQRMLTQRSKLAADLIRKGGFDATSAVEKADEMVDAKKIKNQINQQLGISTDVPRSTKVKMLAPNGKQYMIDPSDVQAAIAAGGKRA